MALSSELSGPQNEISWSFWFYDRTGTPAPCRECPTIGESFTVTDMKKLKIILNHTEMEQPLFPYRSTYNFFKTEFKPNWKEPTLNSGGRYLIVFDSVVSSNNVNKLWNKLLTNLMEKERWGRIKNFINGVKVVRLINSYHKISIWTQEAVQANPVLKKEMGLLLDDLFAYLPGHYKFIHDSWRTANIELSTPSIVPRSNGKPKSPKRLRFLPEIMVTVGQSSPKKTVMKPWEFEFVKATLDGKTNVPWEVEKRIVVDNFEELLHSYPLNNPDFLDGSEYKFSRRGMDPKENITEKGVKIPISILYSIIYKDVAEAQSRWQAYVKKSIGKDNFTKDFERGIEIRRFKHEGESAYQIKLWKQVDDGKPVGVPGDELSEKIADGTVKTYTIFLYEDHKSRGG